ncbi:MAG: hypothetical protein Q8L14_11525 [Myxococcales bacterium]|nr:hypothetical protein [Myxococcales bacterium]
MTLALLVSSMAVLSQLHLEEGRVILQRPDGAVSVEPGCPAVGAVELELLYVGCRDGRVRSFRLEAGRAPALIEDVAVDGELVGLFVANGRVWVELLRREARLVPTRAVSREPLAQAPAPSPMTPVEAPRPAAPTAASGSLLFPEREGGYVSLGAGLGLVVPLGFSGIGLLTDVAVEWHASVPFALRARLWPAGGLIGSQDPMPGGFASPAAPPGGVWNLGVEALFDGRFFGVGLGIGGAQTVEYASQQSGAVTLGAGLTLIQALRIGALDGLHLEGRTTLVSTARSGFGFYGGEGRLGIPVRQGWQLLVGGGATQMTSWGDAGMRIRLQTQSALFITPRAGFAVIQGRGGPSVGVTFDVRL